MKEKNLGLLRWAGGKTQDLPRLRYLFPANFNNYLEPFVGGGAVFFFLRSCGYNKKAILNDSNEELIATYQNLRDNPRQIFHALKQIESRSEGREEALYYETRDDFNKHLSSRTVSQAARFLALNKNNFNGLYRVNRKGFFNAPWGRCAPFRRPSKARLLQVSSALQNTQLLSMDFEACLHQYAKPGDFVYLDPPYCTQGDTSDFTAYSKAGFTGFDQVRLRDAMHTAHKSGVQLLQSNANTETTQRLYNGGWCDIWVGAEPTRRAIGPTAEGRHTVHDLIIAARYMTIGQFLFRRIDY